jgi:hypothetical protein
MEVSVSHTGHLIPEIVMFCSSFMGALEEPRAHQDIEAEVQLPVLPIAQSVTVTIYKLDLLTGT